MRTHIRKSANYHHARVDLPASKLKIEIARVLKEEGFISTYKVVDESKTRKALLRLFLKYTPDRQSVISDLRRVSRPGSRRYVGVKEIRGIFGGLGVSILSTPRGVMTGRAARKQRLGGELLCEIWEEAGRVHVAN